eukprot:FR739336.1.p1 GENE.FR739336.1~~FR739336.1.p1  ORF type:complete len:122 (-),score=0.28 FR739336.1:104-469(-)
MHIHLHGVCVCERERVGTTKSPPYLHTHTRSLPWGGGILEPFHFAHSRSIAFRASHPARLQIGFSLHAPVCPALHNPHFELVSISLRRCLAIDTTFSVYFQMFMCEPTRSPLSTSPVNRAE